MKTFRFLAIFLMIFLPLGLTAETIEVSLPLLPPVINSDQSGVPADFIRLMDEEYKEGRFEIVGVYPFQRSVYNVGRKTDVHWPSLENPGSLEKFNIMYSTETFYKVNFVLYSKKGAGVSLKRMSRYKIGTQRGQEGFFPFKTSPQKSLEGGLKMVDAGRLDGFIFSMLETDMALKKTGLKSIDRTLYKKLNVKMILPNNARGRKVDQIISRTMKKLRASGKYEKLMGFLINAKFEK
ncbi:MAG: hypothetical protein GY866_14410 [Proteobacteria bacterium]|nr:hypothetical protein [Pseudomonadota bacterium]